MTCSLAHSNYIKGLITDWLKTKNVTDFSLFDIVVYSPDLEDFDFTRWDYNFDKPNRSVALNQPLLKTATTPSTVKITQLTNLGGI